MLEVNGADQGPAPNRIPQVGVFLQLKKAGWQTGSASARSIRWFNRPDAANMRGARQSAVVHARSRMDKKNNG